jgi:CRP/FNR family transcriptional regulator
MSSESFKPEKSCVPHVLKKIPLFGVLNDEELSKLQELIVNRRFSKNQIVLLEEDTPKYLYIIYSGKVKVIKTNIDGKEQILAIHKKGDFFGEMSLLDKKTSPASVIAIEDSYIGLLFQNDFENYFLTDQRLLKQIISILCGRLREAWLMVKVLGFTGAEEKIRAILKLISISYGIKDTRGTIIAVRLSHRDIASYASLSRETVTRLIDKFIADDEIEIIDKKYILLKPPFYTNTQCV